jgi:Tol biopolymer transport system component/predicted Ser/Thr protein kinase
MSHATPRPSAIGPYPVEREVGRGGMGIVYLARDTRLDRPVAIKVLPEAFAADPERLARFEREARLLASLNHRNIAAIFGLEEAAGRRFLVLEYVEGETLAQRLTRGPLPVDETVDVCRQIAAALEAAHEGGVIHRDLKPGNVKLTPAGDVKVLDFGLAKGGTGSSTSSDPALSASPTVTALAATGAGVILGTAAYMSPEQARGRAVDRRTDIWSFGCVLYECLTGRQAFAGETVSDVIALILQREPEWTLLPAGTPPRLRELLVRCLTKDPKKRLRDIGEARLLLEDGDASQASGVFAQAPAAPVRTSRLGWIVAAALAGATVVLGAVLVLRTPAPEPVRRLKLDIPPMPTPPRDPALAAISPDGEMIATTTSDSAGTFKIYVRAFSALDGRILSGTDDGVAPAWSPDGRFLVFSTPDKLKKVEARGGSPQVLCPIASYGRGSSWGTRGIIVFSGGAEGPIFQVSQDGGTPAPATILKPGESGHRYPQFLPDGRHFLYASMPPRGSMFDIWIGSTDDPNHREKLMEADGVPVYAEPGLLVYARNTRVMAQRFDARSRKLAGKAIPLPDEPKRSDFLGASPVLASLRGPLGYFLPDAQVTRLGWWDWSSGRSTPMGLTPAAYKAVALSHDDRQAVLVRASSQTESDLWLLDLRQMVPTRLTFGPGRVDRPVWSPDDRRIAYSSNRNGHWDVYVKPAGAAGPGEAVLEGKSLLKYANAWTPDGKTLLIEQIGDKTGWDVFELSLDGDRTLRPLFATPYDEQYASVSADGHWITYTSNESGRFEVFVDSYPQSGRRSQISTAGGYFPVWRADGSELFFVVGNDAIAFVGFDPKSGRTTGPPRLRTPGAGVIAGTITGDFRRSLALLEVATGQVTHDLTMVDGWRAELAKR